MDKRNTEQKKIIKEALTGADHPTASELCDVIHADYPKLSRATVFRVLSQFAHDGEARKLELLGSDTRFDWRTEPHAHCHCIVCGRITDVLDGQLQDVLATRNLCGFDVYSTEIEFNGICPDCKAK